MNPSHASASMMKRSGSLANKPSFSSSGVASEWMSLHVASRETGNNLVTSVIVAFFEIGHSFDLARQMSATGCVW